MYYSNGTFSTVSGNVTIHFGGTTTSPPQPTCNVCSAIATQRAREDGRYWCDACLEQHNRRIIIAQAENWISAAFMAIPRDSRSRLFKSLAAVFHPDTGGDPALMVALNRVRDRFPS